MSAPEISIITPAYNSAPWLGQAVESVLSQDGPTWELLVIDDGSTDETPDLVRRYAALDERIHPLNNKKTKGPSGARNTGMEAARGGSLFFLDSDDALYPGALSALHNALKNGNSPLVMGTGSIFCQQRWLAISRSLDTPPGVFAPPASGFWLHLFRMDFLRQHAIHFPEDLIISEDSVFLAKVYAAMHSPPARTEKRILIYRINHKPQCPNVAKSRAFLRRFPLTIDVFSRHGKTDWIAPYLERYLLSEWLPRLHAVREESRAEALAYLETCLGLLAPFRESVALRRLLAPSADAFTATPAVDDAEAVLDALERQGLIRPMPHFIGLEKEPGQPGWGWYRFSRRAGNVVSRPETSRTLAYLTKLRARSRRRLEKGEPGGSYAAR